MTYSKMVSVITPVYNGEAFIRETAGCLAEQTFRDYQWVIIDDLSTDGTRDICRDLAEKDPRITLLCLEQNSGPIIARNKGMDAAAGRYIAFLDADDLWTPDKLEKQIAFMEKWQVPLSYTSFRKIDSRGKIISRFRIPVPAKVSYKKLIGSNSIPASSAMFDRTIVGEIRQNPELPLSKDDFFFWLEILKNFGDARGMKEDLFRLRIHNESLTNNKLEMARRHWKMYREIFGFSRITSIRYYAVYSVKGLIKYLL
ncbi:MAG: glycosyltransferase family 2 protein [Bacteroidales bacterium]|nr:glycosyltransferase family 2 protein [Bacteroidales bacterium]